MEHPPLEPNGHLCTFPSVRSGLPYLDFSRSIYTNNLAHGPHVKKYARFLRGKIYRARCLSVFPASASEAIASLRTQPEMRYQSFLLASLLSLSAVGADNIVVSNDDGWAELNIRQFYDSLIGAGNSVIISAPAENKSGTGSKSGQPSRLKKPCEFDSCPKGSPSIGHNASMPTINYVNRYTREF